jgi:hypothetical protein
MLKIRASELSSIMTEPKSKSEALSVGSKTFITQKAKEHVFGYRREVTSKYMEKGILVEQDSIDLLNSVFFSKYVKNTVRKENDFVSGECDIWTGNTIVDIKSVWSIDTFPLLPEDGKDTSYEWQVRAYMMLWGVDNAAVAYCLVDTPEHLIGYENPEAHIVSHIAPELRVTLVQYKRDLSLEEKIKEKVSAARVYFESVLTHIKKEHKFEEVFI